MLQLGLLARAQVMLWCLGDALLSGQCCGVQVMHCLGDAAVSK